MCFQNQSPQNFVNLVRIPNKKTFSSAGIIARRIDLCPETSSRGVSYTLLTSRVGKSNNMSGLVFGVWCLGLGVWGLVFGIWCMVYGVWCMVYGVWCSAFSV